MQRNKIKAFTVIELLVSMLIASVVLALAWNVYLFVRNYHMTLSEKAEDLLTLKKMQYYMMADAEKADHWEVESGRIFFISRYDTVFYGFSDSLTVRSTDNVIDSMGFGVSVFGSDIHLKICILQEEIPYCFSVSKMPSSEALINAEE